MNDQLAGQVLEALNDKVDIDYGNMPANSTNYASSSKNVTNCITEIPQDIKLELNDGVLTLKAGSKVYIPNGPGVFDSYTIPNDITVSSWGGGMADTTLFVQGAKLIGEQTMFCYSGTTSPTTTNATSYWYDTTNNQMKRTGDTGSTWSVLENSSLPICIIKRNSGAISSIDQVFNGFGYIGSVRYALPGIKWLTPDGRNEDGTAKSIFNVLQNVVYEDFSSQRDVIPNILGTGSIWTTGSYVESEREPSDSYSVWYKPSDNYIRVRVNNGAWRIDRYIVYAGYFTADGTRVTKLNVKPVFSTLDYNNTRYIGHQAMPSNKFTAMTLGSSGSMYTAPVDGWFFIAKSSNAVNQYINIVNETTGFSTAYNPPVSGTNCRLFLPATKGDVVSISYNLSGSTNLFRFIYTNGSK